MMVSPKKERKKILAWKGEETGGDKGFDEGGGSRGIGSSGGGDMTGVGPAITWKKTTKGDFRCQRRARVFNLKHSIRKVILLFRLSKTNSMHVQIPIQMPSLCYKHLLSAILEKFSSTSPLSAIPTVLSRLPSARSRPSAIPGYLSW